MSDKTQPIVQLDKVRFQWPRSTEPVLDIDSFNIQRGERVFLKGPSGSGKTTLLSLIAAVLTPSSGEITVDDVSLNTLHGGQRDHAFSECVRQHSTAVSIFKTQKNSGL